MTTDLTEGDRRLVYFYTHGRGVKCPACAHRILDRAPAEAEDMVAHYHSDRLLRCDNCLVWIGPANDSEFLRESA